MAAWQKWGLDMFTIMAGYVNTTALAAQTAYRAIAMFVYMLPAGFRMGAQAAMGKTVGEKDAVMCRNYFDSSMMMVLIFSGFITIVYFLFENAIFGIFTNNSDVKNIMAQSWILFSIFSAIDQL